MKSPIVSLLMLAATAFPFQVRGQYVQTNPLEWVALAEGNAGINDALDKQTEAATRTALLQNAMSAEFTKIRQWESKYNGYLTTAQGYATSLRAAATLYEDGVRILLTLGKIGSALKDNTQGALATMSVNDLYLETAAEFISVYSLLRGAIDTGGKENMLTGAERSQLLWELSDKLSALRRRLHLLHLSIRHATLTDVWYNATAGMTDRDAGTIARTALQRWRRSARTVK
jgi:hypothetical protein